MIAHILVLMFRARVGMAQWHVRLYPVSQALFLWIARVNRRAMKTVLKIIQTYQNFQLGESAYKGMA